MKKIIAVIGSGSWGIAMANHLAEMENEVKVWSFSKEEKDLINNERKCMFIPDMKVNENIYCSNDIKEVVDGADFIIHVTPSKFTRNVFKSYKEYVGDKPIIICSKGLEDNSLLTLDQVLKEEKSDVRVGALSGPSYATEVISHIPTAILLGSEDEKILEEIPPILSNEYMRIYKSKDIVGVELGGSLKNIIAFCAGICVELGYGTNAQAALITRGLAEIARLGVKMGANEHTFYGLSGLGDLIVTCMSENSRNKSAGILIAKGKDIDDIKNEIGMVVEGLDALIVAQDLSLKYDLKLPIINSLYDIIYNKKDSKIIIKAILD